MASEVALSRLPERWDLSAEIREARPGNLFPSGIGFHAARADAQRYGTAVNALLRRGIQMRGLEFVRVPKGDRSTRPAADMPVTDQLIYGATVRAIRGGLYPGLVSFTEADTDAGYRVFEEFPLTQRNVKYVLMADAAAFYEYVDHEILSYELIGMTGEADLIEALALMLETWMTVARGLPQGPGPSGPLSDIYISPVERALSRDGFRFSRYSDDFRIIAANWTEARQAQLALETAMRSVSLSVAPGKLFTPKIEKYQAQLTAIRVQDSLTTTDPVSEDAGVGYGDADFTDRPVSNAERERADQIIESVAADTKGRPANTRLLRWALPRAARSGSHVSLDVLTLLLRRQSHLTPTIAQYVRVLMQNDVADKATSSAADWLEGKGFRYPWQVGWILHATCFSRAREPRIAQAASALLFDGSAPWFARGQGALSLAIHGRLPTQSAYVGIYELAPDATRPDLIAAVLIGAPDWGPSFLKGVAASPLERATTRLDPAKYIEWLR